MSHIFRYVFIIAMMALCACGHSHVKDEDHDDHHEHSGISLEPEQAKQFGIETETVTPGEFYDVIKTSGVIEASGSDIATVTARKSGVITLSNGITTGKAVKAGEVIGVISSEGVEGGDVSKAAIANLEAAEAEYKRLKPLYEEGLVTASTFREAERTLKEARAIAGSANSTGTLTLKSPIDGHIQGIYVKTGDYVDLGSAIASIGKNVNMVLIADLPVRESGHLGEIVSANFIPEGKDNVMNISDLNGKKISGPAPGSINGYIPVYFSFTGDPYNSPGGYAEVFLLCQPKSDVISVPREALVEIQGNKYVYILEEDHEYEKLLVKTGASDGKRVEITQGLEGGEKIVSKGASIIRMAEVSAVAPPAHNHSH